ncbi:MAG: acetylserotonin O-methyltransferase [Actinomycetota bacterium]|nr:acetylserotonin O-methyltransferase [Actinomycetota bacterium]
MIGLLSSVFVVQALHVAVELGLADLLATGSRSLEELAGACWADQAALRRLLRMLAAYGVFREDEAGSFALTPLAATLRTDARVPVRDWARCVCAPASWASWGELLHAIKTGEAAFDHAHGNRFYEHLADDPALAGPFASWMTGQSELHNAALLSSYDFSQFDTVVDVGGGKGATLAAVLRAQPAVRGVLLDRAEVVAAAPPLQDFVDRCEIVGGDATRFVPAGGDCYLIKRVLMDHSDDATTAILRKCVGAMAADGRVLVVEMVIAPGNEPSAATTFDLLMLALFPGGRIRTEAEWRALFAVAGLTLAKVIEAPSPNLVLEGRLS